MTIFISQYQQQQQKSTKNPTNRPVVGARLLIEFICDVAVMMMGDGG